MKKQLVLIEDQARQGDVLLDPVDRIPADAIDITPTEGRIVLQYGEVTGHAHAFYGREVRVFQTPNKERYLRVVASGPLQHEEHTHHTPTQRDYRLPPQTEYTDQDEPIEVAD